MQAPEEVLEDLLQGLELVSKRENLIQIKWDVGESVESVWRVLRCHFRDVILVNFNCKIKSC